MTARRVAALAACAFASRVASANELDTFAAGARAEAMAGAANATAGGFASAHHNPAGVVESDGAEAAVGYGGAFTDLRIDGRDAGVTTPRGTQLGLAIPVDLGPTRVAFGLALYLPDQFLARIQLIPASEPRFILLDNGLQHLVVTPVLAVRPLRWLELGAGATLLADAAGNGVDFNVGVVGGQKVGNGALDVSLPLRAAPVVGARIVLPWMSVGVAYRGAIDLNLHLDVLSHVDIAGAVTGDVLISLRAIDLYTPAKLSLGVALHPLPSLTIEGDLEYLRWSDFHGAIPDLKLVVNLGISPALVQAMFPDASFRDVIVPRLGIEWRRPLSGLLTFAARAGYAYERSPVPAQTGLTSFADNDRHVFAAGAGLSLAHVGAMLDHPLSLDVALSWQELALRTTEKDPTIFPGAAFTSDGRMVHLSTTLTVRF